MRVRAAAAATSMSTAKPPLAAVQRTTADCDETRSIDTAETIGSARVSNTNA